MARRRELFYFGLVWLLLFVAKSVGPIGIIMLDIIWVRASLAYPDAANGSISRCGATDQKRFDRIGNPIVIFIQPGARHV